MFIFVASLRGRRWSCTPSYCTKRAVKKSCRVPFTELSPEWRGSRWWRYTAPETFPKFLLRKRHDTAFVFPDEKSHCSFSAATPSVCFVAAETPRSQNRQTSSRSQKNKTPYPPTTPPKTTRLLQQDWIFISWLNEQDLQFLSFVWLLPCYLQASIFVFT